MPKDPDGTFLTAVNLDRDSAILLHRQIHDSLCEVILSGRFVPGARLHSTRVLMQELAVSRTTVRHAFDQLVAEGYLHTRGGSGTYVAVHLLDAPLQPPGLSADSAKKNPIHAASLSERGRRIASALVYPGCPDARPFAQSLPALDQFPVEAWTRTLMRQWYRLDHRRLGYGELAGHRPLREAIASYLRIACGVSCEWERVLIMAGAQQAFNLGANVLLDPGDPVWVEEPGYVGVRGIIMAVGARPLPVPIDEFGLDVRAGCARRPDARLAIITPSHQYPLGTTMPLSRRLEVLAWAYQTAGWVIEDDYDSEFRYSGRPLPALQGLDRHGRVIYVGTFSKVLSPALRLGYLVVPTSLVGPLTNAVGILSKGLPTHLQAALAEFITEGHLARHIRRMRKVCMERQQALLAAARHEFDGLLSVSPTNSGLHLVGWLPEGVDDVAAYEAAISRGIETYPLSEYYLTPPPRGGLMMGFACAPPDEIVRGASVLATALRGVSNSQTQSRQEAKFG